MNFIQIVIVASYNMGVRVMCFLNDCNIGLNKLFLYHLKFHRTMLYELESASTKTI